MESPVKTRSQKGADVFRRRSSHREEATTTRPLTPPSHHLQPASTPGAVRLASVLPFSPPTAKWRLSDPEVTGAKGDVAPGRRRPTRSCVGAARGPLGGSCATVARWPGASGWDEAGRDCTGGRGPMVGTGPRPSAHNFAATGWRPPSPRSGWPRRPESARPAWLPSNPAVDVHPASPPSACWLTHSISIRRNGPRWPLRPPAVLPATPALRTARTPRSTSMARATGLYRPPAELRAARPSARLAGGRPPSSGGQTSWPPSSRHGLGGGGSCSSWGNPAWARPGSPMNSPRCCGNGARPWYRVAGPRTGSGLTPASSDRCARH